MIDIRDILKHTEEFIQAWSQRGLDEGYIRKEVQTCLDTHEHIKSLKAQVEEENRKKKQIARESIKGGDQDWQEARSLRSDVRLRKNEIEEGEKKLRESLLRLPNLPLPEVPLGRDQSQNRECHRVRDEACYVDEKKQPHWDLAKSWGWIDLEAGSRLTGSGFPVFRGEGVRWIRALINFFLNQASQAGYEEVLPPILINATSAEGTGQLPDKDKQMYLLPEEGYYLLPTSEVALMNLYRGSILDKKDFPLKLVAHTPCFRREAGSWGKQVRGLNRLHQFDKVEIVQISLPEHSMEALDSMCRHVEELLDGLELPYRKILLCSGDMGFSAAITYDYEVFSQAQGRWLEVSSVSNCGDFQSRRLLLRYKEDKKNLFPHSLNGSALALPRIIACLMENYQDSDGTGICLPEGVRKRLCL
ncbi:MAG: serine--tRNA ligase [Cytophagales bacterium]|nr:serine--tRNA ligase [Cytophagales bacterium]